MATNFSPEQLAKIAADKARKTLLAALDEKFLLFSTLGQALFAGEFAAIRELAARDLNEAALIRLNAIDLSPYVADHPDWPSVKDGIIALFQ